jgi:hypothetical protein
MGSLLASRSTFTKKLIKASSSKTIGVFMLASALGIAVIGLARYSATASELMPRRSMAQIIFGLTPAHQELYKFSMAVSDVQIAKQSSPSPYQPFLLEVVSHNGETKAILQLQKSGQDPTPRRYEKNLDPETFAQFLQALRQLEVGQLTDLSPYSEVAIGQLSTPSTSAQPNPQANSQANSQASTQPATTETYHFTFQDGLKDYPNSFEVYAPEALEDTRYKALRDLTIRFALTHFGPVLAQ